MKLTTVLTAGTLILAGASGVAASVAISGSAQEPTKTVTVDIPTGATGPPGPAGPPGPTGPIGPAGLECIAGFSPGILVINAPGGQVRVYTCLAN